MLCDGLRKEGMVRGGLKVLRRFDSAFYRAVGSLKPPESGEGPVGDSGSGLLPSRCVTEAKLVALLRADAFELCRLGAVETVFPRRRLPFLPE